MLTLTVIFGETRWRFAPITLIPRGADHLRDTRTIADICNEAVIASMVERDTASTARDVDNCADDYGINCDIDYDGHHYWHCDPRADVAPPPREITTAGEWDRWFGVEEPVWD